ncbi:MAG: VacB/RNase II family 3'-5' exoribonuclease [Phycisphaerales bacterium]|nr:VacB/RNase II family 3'-5' exoribonuclease [Phycisphaerales bacterium]
MSLKYESRLFAHIRHDRYEPAPIPDLVRDLGIDPDETGSFTEAVRAIAAQGRLTIDGSGRVRLPAMPDLITGRIKKNPRGFGFVSPEKHYREGDVFIPPDQIGDALTGDTVRIAVNRGYRNGERDVTGTVLEVLARKRSNFTGELKQRGGLWLVLPDGREITQPIVVDDPTIKNARAGDKVSVEITHYAEGAELAKGVVVKVLGEAGLPDVETQAVIAAYDLPGEFPKACIDDARNAAAKFEQDVAHAAKRGYDKHERLDLTQDFICTIDPPDAKDYDDAISIRKTEDGWDLGVHIADVASFIPPDSDLDREARERGNSVYLPRLVIPMLPEVLSNGICSLSEGVVRFCKSAFMSYDSQGHIVRESVGATAIKSAKRLTYLEAQALIDGDLREARKHAKTEPKYTDDLIRTLREMDRLAKVIRARRKSAGMIHLELPDAVLVFDDAGHVVDAVPEDDAFTHTLIEMFMVEANEVLARLFENMDVPLLRRVHPEPAPGDVTELRQTAKVAGYSIPKNPTRQELQALLDATAGTPAARAVHFAVLRTLTKAEYSPALIGHFALASTAYAHFTSPIRRYPDLTVHRALSEYLRQTDNGQGGGRPRNDKERKRMGLALLDVGAKRGILSEEDLVEIGRHCTRTEENAEEAERSLRQFLVLQLLQDHLGESFPGIVTGVSGAGVFIQMEKYLAEGMIKTADLPSGNVHGRGGAGGGSWGGGGGRWTIDQRSGAMVNATTGRSFAVGDRVSVTIAAIDLAARTMDLVITDPSSRQVGKPKSPQPAKPPREDHDQRPDSGADRRARKSRQRDQGKQDFRKNRKEKRRGR